MPHYRRLWVPGASYFITIVTHHRRPLFADERHVEAWREALRETQRARPFEVVAGVVLPDHLHLLISLPPGDADLSSRMGVAKATFSKSIGADISDASASRRRHRETDVWQRRFYDHMIRDDRDLEMRLDYIHLNPVKHGYCRCPRDWPHSSFHRFVSGGHYASDWGFGMGKPLPDFEALEGLTGE